ncbi:MAG: glycosyltransferase family 4 protein [Trueperaceae bacterium]
MKKIINFVVPQIKKRTFSGGLLCIFEYANALVERGYEVVVCPILPSEIPEWYQPKFKIHFPTQSTIQKTFYNLIVKTSRYIFEKNENNKKALKEEINTFTTRISMYGSYVQARASQLSFVKSMPMADFTVATGYETALLVHLIGCGKKYYFMQHYEPYFTIDFDNPNLARLDAESTYYLPLRKIANSSWLSNEIKEKHPSSNVAQVCSNAIDHLSYYPDGQPPEKQQAFVVISYGGRKATWKGFRDAAESIRLASQVIPNLVWKVYGDAELPSNNSIAPYESLGFITGTNLRQAYSSSHAIICPSWYESFPLFPLEAMACGTAVITTPYGTEEYAFDQKNALVVNARQPQEMAQAIVKLYQDELLRQRLIQYGLEIAPKFNWSTSAARFESLLDDSSWKNIQSNH